MYDMPFIPPSKNERELIKRFEYLDKVLLDMEERVMALSESLDYMDCQVHNIQLQINATENDSDELGDPYDIPDGRLPC